VVAPPFLLEVKRQVGSQVSVDLEGTQLEDRLGPIQAPARPGDVHGVLDQMPAGPFDHTGGDRQALGQSLVVAQSLPVVLDVVGGLVHRLALALAQLFAGSGTAQTHRHIQGPAPEQGMCPILDLDLALLARLRVQDVGGFP
jgi:hypothetical protein